jgi:hypothetical protein
MNGADRMRRRQFTALVGSACVVSPRMVRAQQSMPLVGFLNAASPDIYRFNADSFREGLAKAGFVEGKTVRIEERWARGKYEALPALAAELVAMGVVAIAATGDVASARGAQAASTTVPVVLHDRRRSGSLRTRGEHEPLGPPCDGREPALFRAWGETRPAPARACAPDFAHRLAYESRQP